MRTYYVITDDGVANYDTFAEATRNTPEHASYTLTEYKGGRLTVIRAFHKLSEAW